VCTTIASPSRGVFENCPQPRAVHGRPRFLVQIDPLVLDPDTPERINLTLQIPDVRPEIAFHKRATDSISGTAERMELEYAWVSMAKQV